MTEPVTWSPARSPHLQRWTILGLLGVAQLMLILDVTVVAIALPHMGADLGLGRETLTWVVSGYTLAFGGFLLLGGCAADLFGARYLVVTSLFVFAGASLLTGLASSGPLLLGGRIRQGLAGSPLMDVRLLVRRPVATGALLVAVATALMVTVFFLGSFYFQDYPRYDALRTGLLFLPVALATMVGANLQVE